MTAMNPFLRSQFARSHLAVFFLKERLAQRARCDLYYPYRATDGTYAVPLQLDDHGRTVLDTLRVERRGSYLFGFVNGQPLTELQVDHRVSEGDIYLPSGVTESDIRLMNRDWKLIGGRKKR
jgi:hypothetical protein